MQGLAKKQVISNEHFESKRRLKLVKNGKGELMISDLENLKKFEKETKDEILELEKQKGGVGIKIYLDEDTTIKFRLRKYPVPELRDLCYTLTTFKNGHFFAEFHVREKLKYVKLLLEYIKNHSKK